MENCMTAKDVAAFVRLSLTTVRRLTMNKEIPFFKINRSVRYSLEEIELWLENRKQAAEKKCNKKDKATAADKAKTEGAKKCARTGEGVDDENVTRRAPQKCSAVGNDKGAGEA